MEIRFGLALDGAKSLQPVNRLGYACVGPLGLLAILEIELGLACPHVALGKRVTQYGSCLKACDSEKRFYHQSLAEDQIGVARTLLAWRDEWHLAGWSGGFEENPPDRLEDMAAVEVLAQKSVSPGIGERLVEVIEALSRQRTQIRKIELTDPIAAFPKRWREVLALLPTQEMASTPTPTPTNDLTRLQVALQGLERGLPVARFQFENDGSLVVLEGESSIALAHAIGGTIAITNQPTLIVAERESILLDETMGLTGLPCAGVSDPSALKPALQLLPLALELMWQPLDVRSLLEFLTHSMAPIDWLVARSLAQLVAKTPGVGGGAWQRVLVEATKDREPLVAKQVMDAVDFWLMSERHGKDAGLPLKEVQERVAALAQHLGKNLARLTASDSSKAEDSLQFESAIASLGQCRTFLENLDVLAADGDTHLSTRQLQQLLDLATNDAPSFGRPSEVGHAVFVRNPAAATEPADTVIWWHLAATSLPYRYPWSRREMTALAAVGVELPPLGEQLKQIAATWLRPVLAAQSRLILVMPPVGEEVHPVWQMIQYLSEGLTTTPFDDFVAQQSARMFSVEHRSLPVPRRWWQLPEGITIPRRATESFSSLSVQVENPSKWVLAYAAKLQPPAILTLADGPTLSGKLLHRLFEYYFTGDQWGNHDETATEQWFDKRFESLIDEEGLTLRLAGRQAELARLRDKAKIALKEMISHLRGAGVTKVDCELKVDGIYCGGEISGYADMVLYGKSGEQAVVDLKWSNYKNKYGVLLAENRHVQLALYSKLLAKPPSALPVAYYILNQAQLLAQTREFFPNARLIHNKSGENATQLWLRFEQNWKWRRAQFDQGLIEVVTEQTEPDTSSIPPLNGLPAVEASDRYNDFVRLAGWRADA